MSRRELWKWKKERKKVEDSRASIYMLPGELMYNEEMNSEKMNSVSVNIGSKKSILCTVSI